VVKALVTNDGLLAAMLEWTPQTNKTGHAAILSLAVRQCSGRAEDGRRQILAVGMSHGQPFQLAPDVQ
jgi:hypothetical protein